MAKIPKFTFTLCLQKCQEQKTQHSSKDIPHLAQHLLRMKTSEGVELGKMMVVNGRSISIRTDPAAICQADGDQQGTTPLHCELNPQALHLLVPDSAPAGLFTQSASKL